MADGEVQVVARDPERLRDVTAEDQFERFAQRIAEVRSALDDRVVWNLNSTASGGGVAEMLHVLLAYARGADVDTRWHVVEGDPAFFRLTKRLHHSLHGAAGDEGPLADEQHDLYRTISDRNLEVLTGCVRPDDIVIAHDPQTAGLIPGLRELGARTIWRCHIGAEAPNERTEAGWRFLDRYLPEADAYVFTREAYVPAHLDQRKVALIPPSIDPLAPKNLELDAETTDAVLHTIGIRDGREVDAPVYHRRDGSTSHVRRSGRLVRSAGPMPEDARYIAQVSRWDPLKDMLGVMHGFARAAADLPDVHLLLVGPDVAGVSDDPEGQDVLDRCAAAWDELASDVRARVHLVCLPMADLEENAVMVNAVQRGAAVVVQKSLAEGFGLTVAEAMWKARPVIASARGGIRDQIVDGEHGVLLDDPTNLEAFAEALVRVLGDPSTAGRLGGSARERIREAFLPTRHLRQWADVAEAVLAGQELPVELRAEAA